ncbi:MULTISPECIES: ABC transporter ATP-binding protein [unclassified Brenneria]|uniref:ABC transporter ATP-binding protein n=1 Tax=unclassified Brenneria TaxID=2634434 RepID=UPI00155608D9|nr:MULTISPECIES: sn-glycerol-3-phosphate ABC transporter ATP-binding protein UgpC [unclassified Brenneria]MBJ7220960.1 sn-glycerol-3-phosphate ABC transporter ATP-binding protein UgpC [Brenneria sp. L3-3C-1]MEE3642201.1 sn-glycerol-3-phosphate ABC transporter ATP-binding protein UgpC [Brenneria sp. L3_3C_1]MEE3650427.1 sn-glycerol-3-phosphate ABC transporter ATP-binding protein UgpC [Brenneria sp. HEZEL_4_2_4]NPD00383.1 sn-glycerol-3-phosphate ABC transporter ATP-binding protein UgpC [Brenneria
MSSLILKNVHKSFDNTPVLHDISMEIHDGEFMVFVGPSGCGKSTLLRLIAGLESIGGGDICIDGRRVNRLSPSERGIAMVFQSYALYPHMTVRENMSVALKVAGVSKADIVRKVDNAAQILQLETLLDRKPKQLSGGQRQRVAIGRAIVRSPQVFLFDEPLSNLDAELRVQMRLEIASLHEQLKSTMIYVTHDQVEAMTMADRIAVLRAGRVEQIGTPLDLYHHPLNQFVAGFIGSPKMNFIPLKLLRRDGVRVWLQTLDGQTLTLQTQTPLPHDLPFATLGIRPEHIAVDGSRECVLPVTVTAIEMLGGTSYVHARTTDQQEIVCEVKSSQLPEKYRQADFCFSSADCYLFDHLGNSLPLHR